MILGGVAATTNWNPPYSFTFEVDLDLSEFGVEAGQAANNLYLVSWTQAGNLWVQKLLVWLPDSDQTASSLANLIDSCAAEAGGGTNSTVSTRTQDWAQPSGASSCTGQGWTQQGVALSTLTSPLGQFNGGAAVLFNSMGTLTCTSMGGIAAGTCDPNGACLTESLASTEALLQTEAQGGQACPGPGTPPSLPRVATFKRTWSLDGLFIERALGLQTPDDLVSLP